MRKILVPYLSVFALSIFFISSSASTLYVGDGGYPSIQDAVDASSPGDIIIIKEGFYNGTEINKSITLRGEGGVIEGDIIINADNVTLENLIVRNSYHAMEVHGDNNTIKNCVVAGNSYGMKIDGNNNTILSNKIFDNRFYGINLDFSNDNIVEENELYENMWGMYLEHSDRNLIAGNIIKNNTEGMKIQASYENVIKLNSIVGNDEKGIHMCCKSSENYVFMNNFMKNKMNAYVYGEKNRWDFGGRGNYWDDYNGSGEYVIYGDNIDHCPASSPYALNISSKMEIVIFCPKEGERVSGVVKVEGLNEGGGKVEWQVDNASWKRANGTFFWSFAIDTEKLGNGEHIIRVRNGDTVAERRIYVYNKKSPGFSAVFSALTFATVVLWRYIKREEGG